MINNHRVLAWIPARGGSKGIKDKNIRELCGKPLIAYTIEAAKNSKYVDKVMVSTDSERIAEIAKEGGAWVPSLRPADLAEDYSKTIDAILHTLKLLESMNERFDIFCLLQPTSPLRDVNDLDSAIKTFVAHDERGLVTVSSCETNPVLIRTIGEDGELERLLPVGSTVRRQDMPRYYRVNGSIYINRTDEITKDTSFNDNPIPYVVDDSHGLDIDEPVDLVIAEYMLKEMGKQIIE